MGRLALMGSVLALTGGAAAAQDALGFASDQPISLDRADRCEASRDQSEIVCTGSVVVTQGPAILTSDRVAIDFFPGTQAFRRITADGAVRYANAQDAISGTRAVYDAEAASVTVTGGVVVVQGEQVMTGERLIYNTATGALSFAAPEGGAVRGLFRPQAQGQAEAAPVRSLRD